MDKEKLINYMYEFAATYGKYYHTGDFTEIMKKVSEVILTPEEFLKVNNYEK